MSKKVLLGHLNSNGDCLFATVIARQIKEVDYQNCHLTWAVSDKCRQSISLNPYVDEIWEIPTEKNLTNQEEWSRFVKEAEKRKQAGDFDSVFFTQIIGENELNYDGGIRSSIYSCYLHKITVPYQPVIQLSEIEVENVKQFAERHQLKKYKNVILVECGPDSFEASLNPQSAYQLAIEISAEIPDTAFILSSNVQIESAYSNIIDGSKLSFRENAELTKYCDLFVGCASGISWLATSNWAKKLNMILVIKEDNRAFPSMIYDHAYLNLPTSHIIEIRDTKDSMKKVKGCIEKSLAGEFHTAKSLIKEKPALINHNYLIYQLQLTLSNLEFRKAFTCVKNYIKRNGVQIVFTRHFWGIIKYFLSSLSNKFLKIIGFKKKADQPVS